MGFSGPCEIHKYTYGKPKDIAIDSDAAGTMQTKQKYKDLDAAQKKAVDDFVDNLPKTSAGGCAEKGCRCIEDEEQPKGYPKKSKPDEKEKSVKDPSGPGKIRFKIERTFETYMGHCDEDW